MFEISDFYTSEEKRFSPPSAKNATLRTQKIFFCLFVAKNIVGYPIEKYSNL